MSWLLRGLIGLGMLIALLGLAQAIAGGRSCAERLEKSVESAWVEAWDAVTVASRGGGGVPASRSLTRSERGLRLLRDLESIARDSFGEAELIEPSGSQARVWLDLFLRLYDDALASGGSGAALSVLQLDVVEEDDARVWIELRAASGSVSLSIDLEAECVEGRPTVVRVR